MSVKETRLRENSEPPEIVSQGVYISFFAVRIDLGIELSGRSKISIRNKEDPWFAD